MTIRDQLLAGLVAALAPIVADGALEIDPDGEPATFPGLALFDHGDTLVGEGCSEERRAADFTLEGYCQRAGGADAAAARNVLHAQAVAAIMADETLGGVAELITQGDLRKTVLRFDSGGRLTFAQDLRVQFTTSRINPAIAG